MIECEHPEYFADSGEIGRCRHCHDVEADHLNARVAKLETALREACDVAERLMDDREHGVSRSSDRITELRAIADNAAKP